MQLRPYQLNLISQIREALGRHRRVLVQSPTGSGKCLGRGTPVILHNGRVKAVEDVRVGDRLAGPDGGSRLVISTCTGREQLYRITPKRGGDPFICNESHVLSLQITDGAKGVGGWRGGEIVAVTVREYLRWKASQKHVAKLWRSPGVSFSSGAVLGDPYFIGLWLGDGSSNGPAITTADPEIEDYLQQLARETGLNLRVEKAGGVSRTLYFTTRHPGSRQNPVRNILRKLRLINNKHIPHEFKTAPKDMRWKLLAGLVDSDGYNNRNTIDMVFKIERLARDVVFVARSLGLTASFRKVQKTCTNTGVTGDYWRITLSGHTDNIPSIVPRKKCSPRTQKKANNRTGFSVEPIGVGEYFGFELLGPDRLFLLGDFTVTHNTVIFSYIAAGLQRKQRRALVGSHRQQIDDQNHASFDAWGIPHGRVRSHLPMTDADISVGMIQTIANRLDALGRRDLIVIDEAHHSPAGQWAKVLDHFSEAYLLGFTATPQRLDGKGLDSQYDELILGPTTYDLIKAGYLADYEAFASPLRADLTNLHVRAGEYRAEDVADAMTKHIVLEEVVDHYEAHLRGAPTVTFCATVAHAEAQAAAYRARGWRAEVIEGRSKTEERHRMIEALATGGLNVLLSCEVISEGFDVPVIQGIQMLRKTKSLSLYLQQVGRALRPKADGSKAIILDHVANTLEHGLPDAPRVWKLEGQARGSEDSPITCKECFRLFFKAADIADCTNAGCPAAQQKEAAEQQKAWDDAESARLKKISDEERELRNSINTMHYLDFVKLIQSVPIDEALRLARLRLTKKGKPFSSRWVYYTRQEPPPEQWSRRSRTRWTVPA